MVQDTSPALTKHNFLSCSEASSELELEFDPQAGYERRRKQDECGLWLEDATQAPAPPARDSKVLMAVIHLSSKAFLQPS